MQINNFFSCSIFKQLIVLFCVICGLACNNKNTDIVQKWKVVDVQNPNLKKQIEAAIIDIDTTGNNDDIVTQYISKDSLKLARKAALEADIEEQQALVNSLQFDFRNDERVYISSIAGTDSALWRIENKTSLVIDGPALTGIGDAELYEIVSLSKDTLKLKNVQLNDSVTIIMIPNK
jgi:hypothetical protein